MVITFNEQDLEAFIKQYDLTGPTAFIARMAWAAAMKSAAKQVSDLDEQIEYYFEDLH